MSKRSAVIIGIVTLLLLLLVFTRGGVRPKLPGVKLVLFITVDQFADTYIDRFKDRFSGGLKRLLETGVVYRKVLHANAMTATCPGHASLSTGTFPAKHGIVGNHWYDRERGHGMYCIHDDKYGASPALLKRTGFPDWLKSTFSSSQVYSVSGKDRAAVMMGGKYPDGVYWFDKGTGGFSTSRFYTRSGAAWWLDEFNETRSAKRFYGTTWTPDESIRQGESDAYDFDFGDFPHVFPHKLGSPGTAPDGDFFGDIYRSPFLDELTVDFAIELMKRFDLGGGHSTDYLSVSLSALDTVGHRYGSFSREVEDVLFRVDREIERLISKVEQKVGLENVIIVFSSEHGIPPFPEHMHKDEEGADAHRVSADDIACLQSAFWKNQEAKGEGRFDATLYLKEELISESGFPLEEVSESVKEQLLRCKPILEVYDSKDLDDYEVDGREFTSLSSFKRNYYPERSSDFFVVGKPYHSFSPVRGINHGSPHAYDAEVPLVFLHPKLGKSENVRDERLFITDVAATVAALVGVRAPDDLDGRELPLEID